MIETLINIYSAVSLAALVIVALTKGISETRRRRRLRELARHMAKDASGTLYIRDPQTGALHRLDEQLIKRVAGRRANVSTRQRRRAMRHAGAR